METTMRRMLPARVMMGKITIRCKNRTNWLRVIVMTLASALIGWLTCGLVWSLMNTALSFGAALVSPVGLVFLIVWLTASFVTTMRRNIDK